MKVVLSALWFCLVKFFFDKLRIVEYVILGKPFTRSKYSNMWIMDRSLREINKTPIVWTLEQFLQWNLNHFEMLSRRKLRTITKMMSFKHIFQVGWRKMLATALLVGIVVLIMTTLVDLPKLESPELLYYNNKELIKKIISENRPVKVSLLNIVTVFELLHIISIYFYL